MIRNDPSFIEAWLFLGLISSIAPSTAFAQRDGGMGPDAGGGPVGESPYITYEDTEAYVERTGGTTIPFFNPFPDQSLVTLPFAFHYYEGDYTQMLVGSAGLVGFNTNNWVGTGWNIAFPDPFMSGVTNNIAAFWDDLYAPTVTSHVEGTAPSRVFIVQWTNSQTCCGGTPGTMSVQLWLFEGRAGRFEIHIGPNTFGPQNFVSGSVGFQDATGSRGTNLLTCNPNCTTNDLNTYFGRSIVVTQDAGLDVFARGLDVGVRGVGRVYQGLPFNVTPKVASFHGEPIGPFTYQIHLMAAGEVVPNNPIFTSPSITLAPYQALADPIEVTVPLAQGPGRYRVVLVADNEGLLTEPDEYNNVFISEQEVLISERRPDFAVESIGEPNGSLMPGGAISVPITIANQGNLDGTVAWRLVLSSNDAPSANDLTLASGSEALALLTSTDLVASGTLPADLSGGHYALGVLLDPDGLVPELDEVNNVVLGPGIEINAGEITLASLNLADGHVGIDYTGRLVAGGGDGSFEFQLEGGTLPDGLSLVPNGQLIGRPTAPGISMFEVRIVSGSRNQVFGPIQLAVLALDGPLAIVTHQLVPGIAGQPYPPSLPGDPDAERQRISAVGGSAAVTFTLGAGAPVGLVLDPDGYLHGVPESPGRFEIEVSATDGTETATRRIPIWIVESGRLTLIPTDLPDGTVGDPYQATILVLGGSPNAMTTFTAPNGGLPPGLAVTPTGEIEGFPAQVGTYTFRVRVVEGSGSTAREDESEMVIDIASTPDFGITPNVVPSAILGQPYEVTFEARRGTAPYTWVADTSSLPRGLSGGIVTVNEERFRISGVAEQIPDGVGVPIRGVATMALKVTDALGRTAQIAVALRVVEAPVAPPPMEEDGCGCTTSSQADASSTLGLGLLGIGLALFRRRR